MFSNSKIVNKLCWRYLLKLYTSLIIYNTTGIYCTNVKTPDGTSVFHFLPGLCQCVLGNWCHCFSFFPSQFGNVFRQLQRELFTLGCGGSRKCPIHVVALLYVSEGANRLSFRVSATRSPSGCTMQPVTRLIYIYWFFGVIRRHFGKQMAKETKLMIHNITAKAALKFGSEVWVLKKEMNNV
jgi:hypothetical protein